MAKIKRLGIESMLRAKNADKLTRWEQYRDHKVELVRTYIALLKEHKRIRTWVSIVQGHAMLVSICGNAQARLGECKRRLATFLLAIRYKVRFYMRYATELGGDVWFREKNRARHKMAF